MLRNHFSRNWWGKKRKKADGINLTLLCAFIPQIQEPKRDQQLILVIAYTSNWKLFVTFSRRQDRQSNEERFIQRNITYSVQLLLHITVLTNQLRNLFLQPIILLHQQLVHCTQFPIYCLKPRRLFSLLLSTPTHAHKIKHHPISD